MIRVRVRSVTGAEGYIVHFANAYECVVAWTNGTLRAAPIGSLTVLRLDDAAGYTIMTPRSEVSA